MLDISNYYEQLVIDRLEEIALDSEVPLSQSDLEDVACLALNKLPPSYMRSRVDKCSHTTDLQYLEMCEAVRNVINDAIEQVHLYPHTAR